jgi:microcystin-dependent protein
MDPMLAMICLWPAGFAPQGWAYCTGQTLQVSANTALFSVLGVVFGGNGSTTFNLPDFQSRMPVGVGHGTNLSYYTLGEKFGVETVTLSSNQLPMHNHVAQATVSPISVTINANNTAGTSASVAAGCSLSNSISGRSDGSMIYNASTPNTAMNAATATVSGGNVGVVVGTAGASYPVNILPPSLAINFLIATEGLYPVRP